MSPIQSRPLIVVTRPLLSRANAFGCYISAYLSDTPVDGVSPYLSESAAVFVGTLLRFEQREPYRNYVFETLKNLGVERTDRSRDRIAILRVDRWWRTSMPPVVVLATEEETDPLDAHDPDIEYQRLTEGESYLIYARGTLEDLQNGHRATAPNGRRVDDEVNGLGPGHLPVW